MSRFIAIIGSILAAFASAQESPKEWSLTNLRPVTILTGVHATVDEEVFAAISDNAQGPGVEHSTDYGATGEFIATEGDAINMDIAFTDSKVDGTMVGMGGFLVTHDGQNFERLDSDLRGISQSVSSGGDLIGATGSFYFKSTREAVNGVAVSTDAGQSWKLYDLNLNSTSNYARYGAFPSAETWFVSSGMWPSDDEEGSNTARGAMAQLEKHDGELTPEVDISFPISQRITRHRKDGKHSFEYKEDLGAGPGAKAGLDVDPSSWYFGAISKTTDGGATFEKVLDLMGLAYFNGIHCSDTDNCLAVAENSEQGFAYMTSDGGASWKQVLATDPAVSMMGAFMLSPTEAWASGGTMQGGKLVGNYYHTVDGGATWTLEQLTDALSMDITFSKDGQRVGYSTAMNRSLSTVAVYK